MYKKIARFRAVPAILPTEHYMSVESTQLSVESHARLSIRTELHALPY